MDKPIITTTEAAPIIGMNRIALDAWIRSGTCPFGQYIIKGDNSRGAYYVFRERMLAWLAAEDIKAGSSAS